MVWRGPEGARLFNEGSKKANEGTKVTNERSKCPMGGKRPNEENILGHDGNRPFIMCLLANRNIQISWTKQFSFLI